MSETLTGGNRLGSNDSTPAGRICQKRSAGEPPEKGRTLSRHPLLKLLSRLLSISGVSLLADDHWMRTVAERRVVIMRAKAICVLIFFVRELADRSNA